MRLVNARRLLLVLWFIGAAVPFSIIFVQTIADRYDGRADEAWSWLLPCIMPTIGLMIAVTITPVADRAKTDKFVVFLASAVSIAYLILVTATILAQPISPLTPSELFERSHLWLAPSQGVIDAILGTLFLRSEKAG